MEIIVPHLRTDFDAFASMLCAKKLYCSALPILPSNIIYKLKEFISLYRDVADFQNIRYLRKLKKTRIEHVIIVDTKKMSQLTEFEKYINSADTLTIYDHHPPTSDDLAGCALELYPYGANTTGLFYKLCDEGIELTPQEATIALLGIYADTGNLTFPCTTSEDAVAAGELMRLKADLQTVNRYLRPYFDPAQRILFRDMLENLQEIHMEGYKVVLIKRQLEKPMQGTANLMAQASDMVGADAIIGVFSADGKPGVQILIQSHVPEINAGEICGHFEGGGHPGAAAAFLPRADMDGVADTVMTLLTEVPLPTTKVKDLMSCDVFTVTPDQSLKSVASHMSLRGIRGAPVINDCGEIVGMISKRDVEKADMHGLLNSAPTSGFMSEKVRTVEPDMPLVSARKVISSLNIGHLPVMEGDRLIGIVSRTDILNAVSCAMPDELRAGALSAS